jgi:dihydropyrimidine dehydrogenase (NAD+) subunit PreA
MVAAVAADQEIRVPISGIGGIQAWQDAVEFLLLGASSVQVCTAVMHFGFRIIEQLKSGLESFMAEKGYRSIRDFSGLSVPRIKSWGDLDLNFKIVAHIDQQKCIHCGLCYIACEDGCHQSIRWEKSTPAEFLAKHGSLDRTVTSGGREVLPGAGGNVINLFTIEENTCVGCNMCSLVCPVEGCISMREVDTGLPPMSWNQYQAKSTKKSASSRLMHIGGLIRSVLPYKPPLPIKSPRSLQSSSRSAVSVVAGSFDWRSRTSSTPSIKPMPRTSPINGCRSCKSSSRSFRCFPTTWAFA